MNRFKLRPSWPFVFSPSCSSPKGILPSEKWLHAPSTLGLKANFASGFYKAFAGSLGVRDVDCSLVWFGKSAGIASIFGHPGLSISARLARHRKASCLRKKRISSSTLGLTANFAFGFYKAYAGSLRFFLTRNRSIHTWSGNRTRTGLLPQDFKSCVSTSSTIQANFQ